MKMNLRTAPIVNVPTIEFNTGSGVEGDPFRMAKAYYDSCQNLLWCDDPVWIIREKLSGKLSDSLIGKDAD
jgi:hypothetical protein